MHKKTTKFRRDAHFQHYRRREYAPLKIFLGIQKYISMSINENFYAESHIFPRIRVYREKICDFHAKGQNPSVIASRPCIAYWWRGNHWGENLLRKTNDCPIRKKWKKRPVEKVFFTVRLSEPQKWFFFNQFRSGFENKNLQIILFWLRFESSRTVLKRYLLLPIQKAERASSCFFLVSFFFIKKCIFSNWIVTRSFLSQEKYNLI